MKKHLARFAFLVVWTAFAFWVFWYGPNWLGSALDLLLSALLIPVAYREIREGVDWRFSVALSVYLFVAFFERLARVGP